MLSSNTHTIYLVSEDIFCLTMYQQLLKNMGYQNIHVFTSEKECLDNISRQPDIVIVHCSMQLQNGIQLLERIKKDSPGIYVLLISGNENKSSMAEVLQMGAFEYILSGPDETQQLEASLLKIQKIVTALSRQPNSYKKQFPNNPL